MSRRSAAYAAGIGEANRPHSNKGESFREFCARAAAHSSKYALYRTFHRKGEAFREQRRVYLTPIHPRSVPEVRIFGSARTRQQQAAQADFAISRMSATGV